ncbi:TIR domain-containing protein [Arthrobacter celericrescens]|uniref:TIR domain-containing protein n=1 Tax=Arthrobacter celericrescens TaxID=2320851 RepID=UPI000EA00423|nr:TIR domain-containing protein [Arthrobacter celericrescens]
MSGTAASPSPGRSGRRVFISYAREDQDALNDIRAGISALHHEAWVDSNLDGGQAWWDVILEQIRTCDAMILVVSPSLIDSEAATRERDYARRLRKPLIPLVVKPVRSDLLPPDIATLQFIDYTNRTPLTGAQLANALFSVPTDAALPEPLPDPPAVPVSYLGDLAADLRREALSADEQFSILAKLRASLERPREHDAAAELLGVLEGRRDLLHQVAKDIERVRQDDDLRSRASHPIAVAADSEPVPAPQKAPEAQKAPEPILAAGGHSPTPQAAPAAARNVPHPNRQAEPFAGNPQPVNPGVFPQAQTNPAYAGAPMPQQQQSFRQLPQDFRFVQQPAPPQRLALSIIALVLFIPLGAVALYFSTQVPGRWNTGNPAGALDASKKAQLWGWIGIGVGGFFWFVSFASSLQTSYYY